MLEYILKGFFKSLFDNCICILQKEVSTQREKCSNITLICKNKERSDAI